MNNKYLIGIIIVLACALTWSLFNVRTEYKLVPGQTVTSVDTSSKTTTTFNDAAVKGKLKAKLDTSYTAVQDSSTGEVDTLKNITASADTTFEKDSLQIKIKYHYPPQNYFELAINFKEKIIETIKTITMKTVETVELPFYKDTWFWTTIIEGVVVITVVLIK